MKIGRGHYSFSLLSGLKHSYSNFILNDRVAKLVNSSNQIVLWGLCVNSNPVKSYDHWVSNCMN